jgi:hypothetical protein
MRRGIWVAGSPALDIILKSKRLFFHLISTPFKRRIKVQIKDALHQINVFSHSINSIHPEYSYEIVKCWDGPFREWFRKEVPATGYSKQSGVYLFSNRESEILYIGKAGANNFAAEIYSKFRAASKVDEKDVPYFGNSPMAKWASNGYASLFLHGEIYISAVCIYPQEFSSLIEVYLHVWCSINGGLPPLNNRIG